LYKERACAVTVTAIRKLRVVIAQIRFFKEDSPPASFTPDHLQSLFGVLYLVLSEQ
jgi:hypothetical protein